MDDILIKIHQKRHQKALFTLELFDAFSYLNVKDYFQVNLKQQLIGTSPFNHLKILKHLQPTATIRSIANLAFLAVSSGTVMICLFFFNAVNTLSKLIIFINGQTACGFAAMNFLFGFCFCI